MPAPNPSTKQPSTQFEELKTIRDPDGVIAVVTKRIRDGRISFTIAREFEEKGVTRRSAYLAARHMPAVRRLLNDLEEILELEEDRARAKLRPS